MIVLDTTVLVYATGDAHALRDPSRELIAAVADRRIEATTTVEVIHEFTHVRAQRCGRADAVALAGDCIDLLSPLLTSTREHLRSGLSLFDRDVKPLGIFEAVLAAIALDVAADALVSANPAFADVPGLRHVPLDAVSATTFLPVD